MNFQGMKRDLDMILVMFLSSISILLFIFTSSYSFIRAIAILPLIIFYPGYSIISFFFHRRGGILRSWKDQPESTLPKRSKIAFSFMTSIGYSSLVAFILNEFYPIYSNTLGLRAGPVMIVIYITTMAVSMGVIIKNSMIRVPDEKKITSFKQRVIETDQRSFFLSVFLVLILIISASVSVYYLQKDEGDSEVELYILGFNQEVQKYPDLLVENDVRSMIIGINNPTDKEVMGYIWSSVNSFQEVKVDTDLDPFIFNGSSHFRRSVLIEPGEKLEFQLNFTIRSSGKYRLQIELVDQGERSRSVWLNLKVFDPGMLWEDEDKDIRIYLTDLEDRPLPNRLILSHTEPKGIILNIQNNLLNILRVNASIFIVNRTEFNSFEFNITSPPTFDMIPGVVHYNNTIMRPYSKGSGAVFLNLPTGENYLYIIVNELGLGCIFKIEVLVN